MNTTTRKINLNLSATYVKNWTPWEVSREIICNAIDADPTFEVSWGTHSLTVTTETCPTIDELTVIGAGTKSAEGSTIGQFGEGFKLACLTAIRLGGYICCYMGNKLIEFRMEQAEGCGIETLHAIVNEVETVSNGFVVEINLAGIEEHQNKILTDRTPRPISKVAATPCKVYMQGIFITQLGIKSALDYNLPKLPLNRDRDALSSLNIQNVLAQFMKDHLKEITEDDFLRILAGSGDVLEQDYDFGYLFKDNFSQISANFSAACKQTFSIKERVAHDPLHDINALEQGYTVLDSNKFGSSSFGTCVGSVIGFTSDIPTPVGEDLIGKKDLTTDEQIYLKRTMNYLKEYDTRYKKILAEWNVKTFVDYSGNVSPVMCHIEESEKTIYIVAKHFSNLPRLLITLCHNKCQGNGFSFPSDPMTEAAVSKDILTSVLRDCVYKMEVN